MVSAILDTVGALVVVLDPEGRIVRFNRACEQISGYSFDEVKEKYFWDLCVVPEEAERFKRFWSERAAVGTWQPRTTRATWWRATARAA